MDLAVKTRDKFGKAVRHLRQKDLIPAELYGHDFKNVHLMVPEKDFMKVFKQAGENTVVNLVIGDRVSGIGQNVPVLIYNVTYHPVSDKAQSIDFYQVKMDEKLKTKVPVEFIGESPAVKHLGGILVKALQEVEVEALPNDIPHSFTVDLSKLAELNQSFYIKDLTVAGDVKLMIAGDAVVATVKPKMTEEEAKALEEKAVPSVETIKVETEEKKAEREANKEVFKEGVKEQKTEKKTVETKK